MSDVPDVVDNAEDSRFEIDVDGHPGVLVYERDADRIVLVHTEVAPELGGRGLGGALVTAAVAAAARDGLTVVPHCGYARHWLETHPDVAATVEIDWAG